MELVVQTFALQDKTLYYVQCPVCKRNRILNSVSNVSHTVSQEALRKLCGCTCSTAVKPAPVKALPVKEEVKKRTGKAKGITAVIAGREMTVREIADTYQLSTSTVRQRIQAGKSEAEIIAPSKKTVKQ